MEKTIKNFAFAILTAIHEIETFMIDVPDFEGYKTDIKTKRAIERNLEIIGEAVNRIYKVSDSIQFTNARKIIETRNRIIHGYDTVSDEILWSIITTHIPVLRHEIEQHLGE